MKEIYPTAKISSIKKYGKKTYVREGMKKYDTSKFMYLHDPSINEFTAMYKPTKQMFKWSTKTRKWRKLNYKPGQR